MYFFQSDIQSSADGFTIIFDNLNGDKRARDVHEGRQNFHYDVVQGMAVFDRVSCPELPTSSSKKSILSVEDEKWLVSEGEYNAYIREPAKIIVQRILARHMAFFKDNFAGNTEKG